MRAELAKQVLDWWEENQHRTTGEHGGQNVFDSEPDFVATARKQTIMKDEKETTKPSIKEAAKYFIAKKSNFPFTSVIENLVEFAQDWQEQQEPTPKTKDEVPLPPFLYEYANGRIMIGYHGDTEVTEEWNEWISKHVKRLEPTPKELEQPAKLFLEELGHRALILCKLIDTLHEAENSGERFLATAKVIYKDFIAPLQLLNENYKNRLK